MKHGTKKTHTEGFVAPVVRCGYVVLENDFTGMRTVLRDTCAPGKCSLTNDAHNVVAQLLRDRTIAPGGRLFYYDSDDQLDEIVYDADGFVDFAPGPRDMPEPLRCAVCGGLRPGDVTHTRCHDSGPGAGDEMLP